MPKEQTPEHAVVVVVRSLELAADRKMELVAEQRLDVVAVVAVVDLHQTGLCQNEFLIRIIVDFGKSTHTERNIFFCLHSKSRLM